MTISTLLSRQDRDHNDDFYQFQSYFEEAEVN